MSPPLRRIGRVPTRTEADGAGATSRPLGERRPYDADHLDLSDTEEDTQRGDIGSGTDSSMLALAQCEAHVVGAGGRNLMSGSAAAALRSRRRVEDVLAEVATVEVTAQCSRPACPDDVVIPPGKGYAGAPASSTGVDACGVEVRAEQCRPDVGSAGGLPCVMKKREIEPRFVPMPPKEPRKAPKPRPAFSRGPLVRPGSPKASAPLGASAAGRSVQ